MSGESKSGNTIDRELIQNSSYGQQKAIAKGKTVGQAGRNVAPPPFTLRQRGFYPDELYNEAGDALYQARTRGVLRGIHKSADTRNKTKRISRAMGRENMRTRLAMGHNIKSNKGPSTAHHVTRNIANIAKHNISDLTKTGEGAPSIRKGREASRKSRKLKTPSKGGKKRRKSRKKRRRKSKKKRRTRRHKRVHRRRSRRR